MRKPVIVRHTPRSPPPAGPLLAPPSGGAGQATPAWQRGWLRAQQPPVLWLVIALLALACAVLVWQRSPAAAPLTQKDIDAAVLRTLTTQALPSATARAAALVGPSVVRVVALGRDARGRLEERGEGTGVVIINTGIILTNLHVVQEGEEIQVVFADGSESEASIRGIQAKDDLAVLQAATVPDDLRAATLRSTSDLMPGHGVVAVGFPFGIGPSVSAGVVSGLGRSFQSSEGDQELTNLIQFDAAANPGNSGGPLVTLDGEVVGIVTGILNPTKNRTFLGIGFAVPIENAAGAVGLPPF